MISSLSIIYIRGGSIAAATSKMEHFVIIVKGFKSLAIITKHSNLDVAAALDWPLYIIKEFLDVICSTNVAYFSIFL